MNPAPLPDDAAAIDQVTRLEHLIAEAAMREDYAAIDGLPAPEFVGK